MTFIDLVGGGLFRSLPIRGILAGSETFPVEEQVRFEQEFGIRVTHWYGHSEYAALAYGCRQCRSFHFYPTYGQVELLDSETEGCPRIVASSFNRIGTQFVRYDTGDLAVAPTGTCAHNHFSRADSIVGRSQETFIDSSGLRRSLGPYLFGIHGSFWDQIRDLQVVQDQPGVLRMRLVANPGIDKSLIQQTLERRMPMTQLEFEYVPVIERSPSGKRRYFVDGLQAAVAKASPSQLDSEAPFERARMVPGRRWITVAAVILMVAVTVMSLFVTGASGRHTAVRAHHRDDPIGNVKVPGDREIVAFASNRNPWVLDGQFTAGKYPPRSSRGDSSPMSHRRCIPITVHVGPHGWEQCPI